MNQSQIQIYEFGEFRVDAVKRLLVKGGGEQIPLTPKVFDTLLYLVENSGKVIEKDELMAKIWTDTIVEENNLSQNISILRRVLGEKRGEHRFIATIPGRGFKFVASVQVSSSEFQVPGSSESEISNLKLQNDPESSDDSETGNFTPQTGKDQKSRTGRRNRAVYAVAAVIILLAGGWAFYLWFYSTSPKPVSSIKTMAVLPFKPLVAENRDEALEIGMADTLIARLSGNREVIVRPLGSVRRFNDLTEDPQKAGRELGVESVLDGSIQRWGNKIRVNVGLTSVADGSSLWSGTFDEKFTNIFEVQDAIAVKVVEALRLRLGIDDYHAGKRTTHNVEAYRFYLQGRNHALKSTPPDIRKGIAFYQQAIDADPLYALAYAGMADAYRTLPITSDIAPKEAFPKAKTAALKALEIDDQLPEAHIVLGYVASWHEWDWKTAETEITKAVEISPNNSDARRAYSLLLTVLGKHDAAVDEMRKARELDPLSLPTNALEGQALHYAGRDAEALVSLNKTFEIDPNFWIARVMLARILLGENKFDEALTELNVAKDFSGGNSETISLSAYALAKIGRRDEASAMLEGLKSRSDILYVPSYNIAMIYKGLGDDGAALSWLERAVEDRDVRLILLKVEPKWNNLRSEQRFIDLMKRLRFE